MQENKGTRRKSNEDEQVPGYNPESVQLYGVWQVKKCLSIAAKKIKAG